jgi:tetratricopeptide (TPR) repeat protein
MRDETHRKSALSLQRPARLRPSWRRRLAGLVVIAGACAAIAGGTSEIASFVRRKDCASLAHKASVEIAAQVCLEEYQRTGNPKTGARLAHALLNSRDVKGAKRLATSLRASSARPEALRVLGQVAKEEGRPDEAMAVLEEARLLHRVTQEFLELARDDAVLVSIRADRSEYVQALQLADECIAMLRREPDAAQECHCRTVAGRALSMLGHDSAAEQELKKALSLDEDGRQHTYIENQQGDLAQERDDHRQAIEKFTNVLRDRERAGKVFEKLIPEETLAYSLAEVGRIAEAKQHLDNARRLDVDRTQVVEQAWTAARIAYREHDLPRAAALTDKYFELRRARDGASVAGDDEADDPEDRDDRIDVLSMRARIELERDEPARAASWAQRAVCQVERVRKEQSNLELRPWVLKKRRFAYELRFTALARMDRVEDAAMAFDLWQWRTVQDALARPRSSASLDWLDIADQATRQDRWMQATKATFAKSADRTAVLQTMRGIDLLALIVANDEVWRLTAHHGAPRLSIVGPRQGITDRVRELASQPSDIGLATALGALLVPDDLFRETSETLHVVIDEQLTELPVAALRRGNTSMIAARPIVRELRLPEVRCVPPGPGGHATVLGDPDGTLGKARLEAEHVAEFLGTTSKTGPAATPAALWAARGDAVLHVAAHNTPIDDEAALRLWGGEVTALEIAAGAGGPALVVLSSCSAATVSTDNLELIGSLAAGFLAAGSRHVVGTLRSISDRSTPDLFMDFYRAGGVSDPVRALRAAQLASTDNIEWPLFTVFGPDVCLPGAPAHP